MSEVSQERYLQCQRYLQIRKSASEVKQVLLCLAAEPLKCLELGLNSCSAQLSMDACSIQVLEMLGRIGTSEDADISFTHSPLNAQVVAQKLGEGDVP